MGHEVLTGSSRDIVTQARIDGAAGRPLTDFGYISSPILLRQVNDAYDTARNERTARARKG